MAKATDYFSPSVNREFNLGYHAGYSGSPAVLDSMAYQRGFLSGAEDRAADARDMATGELDGLSESERDFLYGVEERTSNYR